MGMIFRWKIERKTWPKQSHHHKLVSTSGKERRETEKAEFYWTGRLVVEIAEFYWEGRLVAVETRVLLDRTTCCRDCGVLLGRTTYCCGDESFTGQDDLL